MSSLERNGGRAPKSPVQRHDRTRQQEKRIDRKKRNAKGRRSRNGLHGIIPRLRAVVPLLLQPTPGQVGIGVEIGKLTTGALGHGGSNQPRRQLSHPRLQATVKPMPGLAQRPRPRSPPKPRRGDESKPKSAGISLEENPTWMNRSPTPTRETSTPLRLRPNVKSELEDEVYAAAAEIAAGDPIEVSDEENDWNQCCAEPSTGPQPSRRPESEVPALWGMSRANRRRPTEAHHYLPPQLTAYRTSAGVLLDHPIVLQSLNKGQSRIVYSITNGIVMKLTSRLQEHGEEHSFSLQFSAFCAKVLGLRILRTELVHDGQTSVHQLPALFQVRVFRLTQWLERWGSSLEGVEKTALGYYLLGLLGSIMLSKVRPRDFGSSNLGVRSLDQRACELVLYDLASWERHSDVYRARLNINPAYEWLSKALGHSFHMHLRVYQDMYSRPEELVPFCLSQCDLFREHAERQFGAHLITP